MQNNGAIKALAIVFGLIFLYQLSFTLVTKSVEKKAAKYAQAMKPRKTTNWILLATSTCTIFW